MEEKNSFKKKTKFCWDDVKRLPQYEGKATILNLKYPPEYVELMDYFRAIVRTNEYSERSFELTSFVLDNLSSNYNAYLIRRKCLEQLPQLGYEKEKEYVTSLVIRNPKTYQAWEHRRYVIEVLNSPQDEIKFLEEHIFSDDNKNYHGWSYRIWVCQKFDLYEEEWERLEKYFEEDIRNNSAWNYRYFLLSQKLMKDEEQFRGELKYIFKAIKQVPDNESAWNYLMGWFKTYEFKALLDPNQKPGDLNIFERNKWICSLHQFPEVSKFAEELIEECPKNRYLFYLCIQIKLTQETPTQKEIQQSIDVCELLAYDIDKIRHNYWMWFQNNIKSDFSLEK